jgi:hypothetical protein
LPLFLLAVFLLSGQPAIAGGADDWFREFFDVRNTDPQAFYLMCGCVSLIVFLALTIFGGFIACLYGWGSPQKKPSVKVAGGVESKKSAAE